MRTPLSRLLLAAAVLSGVASQGQTVDICDRTPQVRDAILGRLEPDDCAAVGSERLASVETLNLRAKQLTALQAGDFDNLTSLERLWLHDNQLTTLPDGVFDDPASLERLWLHDNQLTTCRTACSTT